MPFAFSIPSATSTALDINLDEGDSLIIVGANGSGKTRLAAWIERRFGERAHRISAHRALSLKPSVPKIREADALKGLRFGNPGDDTSLAHRSPHRWKKDEAVSLLNDFDFLLQALFAEQSRTALDTHKSIRSGLTTPAAETKFETLQSIWEHLLPHRELVISGDDIQARRRGHEAVYSASSMSDGERAVFYMLGQALMAPENSIFIVDEPELHMHRSIMSKLWDRLENTRTDCAFVFITHDLDFAASRVGQKIVIDDYQSEGPSWSSRVVPEESGFDEELTTLLLGSRRPILFAEGDMSSLELAMYRCVYPGWTVVPRNSCKDVVHAVCTMRANAALTRISCKGIVDADDYDEEEVAALAEASVHVLSVSEIENVLLLPEVSTEIAVADYLQASEVSERLGKLKDEIFEIAAKKEFIEAAVNQYCLRRIDRTLKRIDLKGSKTVEDIALNYTSRVQALDINSIACKRRMQIEEAISSRNLPGLLALVDGKGMLASLASKLRNTTPKLFQAWLTRVLMNDRAPRLVAKLRDNLPMID